MLAAPAEDPGFALGEDTPQNCSGRAAQEANWAETNVDARRHYSMREALQLQKPVIQNALADHERVRVLVAATATASDAAAASLFSKLSPELLEPIVAQAMPGQAPLVHHLFKLPASSAAPTAFRIFVRCRPLRKEELAGGEYEAVESVPARATASALVCHRPLLARTGRRLSMMHRTYACDGVFGPADSDEQVRDAIVKPLLQRVRRARGNATVILYGQTGAGKTHTLRSLLACVEQQLDEAARDTPAGAAPVEVTFYEVATAGCADLLHERAKVVLRADENDVVHACGARTCSVGSGAALREVLAGGLALRSTI